MREFKFRAWDSIHKRFTTWEDDKYNVLEFITRTDGQHVITQYTGLKDKNGKEIYEGDCVIWAGFRDDVVGEVYFDKGGFQVRNYYVAYQDIPSDAFGEGVVTLQVIGNIYENPELIK